MNETQEEAQDQAPAEDPIKAKLERLIVGFHTMIELAGVSGDQALAAHMSSMLDTSYIMHSGDVLKAVDHLQHYVNQVFAKVRKQEAEDRPRVVLLKH